MLSGNSSTGNSDSPQKSLQIKQDSKFYRKLLSKETSPLSNPSFRVYYGAAAAGSVPFVWESQPGTPKHCIQDANFPPLTPPPSYQSNLSGKKRRGGSGGGKRHISSKSGFLAMLFKKASSSTPSTQSHRPQLSSSGSSESSMAGEEEDLELGSSKSTLCYRRWWL